MNRLRYNLHVLLLKIPFVLGIVIHYIKCFMNIIWNILQYLLLKIRIYAEWIILCLIFLLVVIGLFFPQPTTHPTTESFLVDSSSASSIDSGSRQEMLLNAVHEHLSYAEQGHISQNNLRMQGRIFFITIFAALISVIMSLTDERRRPVSLIAALFGLFWYGINVHVTDIENRGTIVKQMFYNTEYKLLEVNRDSIQNYHLDFRRIDTVYANEKTDHFSRKVKSFFAPDTEQIFFNLTPIGILLILHLLQQVIITRKRRLTSNSS